jgi:hypothetical protein
MVPWSEGLTLILFWRSIPNPLHASSKTFWPRRSIEFRGSAVGVAGNSLSGFKGAVIFQKIGDAGRPK